MLKIDIISGFLGAGKTTFIKRLLNTKLKDEKIVLIENEYGEVSVDTDLLKDSKIEIKELSQGCICCSLVGDFSKSLKMVIETYNPDRIIIEPSGVGKLSDIINAVASTGLQENVNSLVCVVDAKKAKMYEKNFGEFFVDQIEVAHTIILSRTDVAKEDAINQAVEVVRKHNPNAVVVTTSIQKLSDEELVLAYEGVHSDLFEGIDLDHLHEDGECDDPNCCCHHHHHHDEDEEHEHHHHHHDEDEECCCHHHHDEDEECCCHHDHDHDHEHHHHHHADEVFSSVGIETPKKYDINALKALLDKMASGEFGLIVRSKGIVEGTDGKWYVFNLTPEEVSVEESSAIPMGKIVVIGSKINEEEIKKLF